MNRLRFAKHKEFCEFGEFGKFREFRDLSIEKYSPTCRLKIDCRLQIGDYRLKCVVLKLVDRFKPRKDKLRNGKQFKSKDSIKIQ